jgi:hypothetical protein
MEYYDQEYLNLFKQVREQKIETKDYSFVQLRGNATNLNNYQMLKETPNYTNYNNINEVQRNPYSQEMNLNEFNIETRINGVNINEVKRQQKEDRLNEVMEHLRQERLKTQENQNLNETINFKDADIITLEMFEKARFNSMMMVANRILPK